MYNTVLDWKDEETFEFIFESKGKNSRVLKNVQKRCEYACGGKTELVTCPSCEQFGYYVQCLESMFQMRQRPMADLGIKWECPHC